MIACDQDTRSIRQMSEAFDLTPRTLRFYEAKELLFPIRQGTRRMFIRKDRARLTLILRGKRFGFSLEDIRQLLNMYDPVGSNAAQMMKTYDLAKARLAQMQSQRNELDQSITELAAQITEGATILANLHKTAGE